MGNDEPDRIDRLLSRAQRSARRMQDREAHRTEEAHAGRQVFPLRVAAIDVGSNAIRFLGVEFLQPQHYVTLEEIRTPVRLGHGVFQSGRLDAEAMDAAVATLASYRERIDACGIAHYRAVATSAVRESENGDRFVERVRDDAGILLEPITGAEEARLVHGAVCSRIDLGRSRWMLVDLGGGSVEVSVADARRVHWTASYPMGAVRLLEDLAVEGDDLDRFRRRLEEYIAPLRVPTRGGLSGFIATGGNSEALARLANAPEDSRGVARLSLRSLREAIEMLSSMSSAERIERLALRADRADVILPAAMVYERLCARAGFDEVLVPQVGVRDGLVLDLADELAQHTTHARRQARLVRDGAHALGRRYRFDRQHARHVTKLALSLFDQLGALHQLGKADRRVLMAAGLLHDVGVFISYKRHHKHSLYLIANAELPGLSSQEILLVANVARYHRKGHPSARHEAYMLLPGDARERVSKLAGILRIADALDREHAQRVDHVVARVAHGRMALELHGSGDLELEHWAVGRKGKLFEEVFDLEIELRDGADE